MRANFPADWWAGHLGSVLLWKTLINFLSGHEVLVDIIRGRWPSELNHWLLPRRLWFISKTQITKFLFYQKMAPFRLEFLLTNYETSTCSLLLFWLQPNAPSASLCLFFTVLDPPKKSKYLNHWKKKSESRNNLFSTCTNDDIYFFFQGKVISSMICTSNLFDLTSTLFISFFTCEVYGFSFHFKFPLPAVHCSVFCNEQGFSSCSVNEWKPSELTKKK